MTTFATMAYIVVVNPAILKFAGLPVGPSAVATILVVIVGSLLMGLYANRPLAVAPYMGENAFIAFGLAALGIGWQLRLGAVFVSGVIFLVINLVAPQRLAGECHLYQHEAQLRVHHAGDDRIHVQYWQWLAAGLVLYPLLKLAAGRGREISGGSVVLGMACLAYFVLGVPH